MVNVSLKDLERDKDFRLFGSALSEAYERGIAALRDRALADGYREVHAIAVGGGAAAPFIKALIQRKPRNAGKVKVIARPATPSWAHAPAFNGNLAPVFPQLAIAIGGALAPESMIAARGGVRLWRERLDAEPSPAFLQLLATVERAAAQAPAPQLTVAG